MQKGESGQAGEADGRTDGCKRISTKRIEIGGAKAMLRPISWQHSPEKFDPKFQSATKSGQVGRAAGKHGHATGIQAYNDMVSSSCFLRTTSFCNYTKTATRRAPRLRGLWEERPDPARLVSIISLAEVPPQLRGAAWVQPAVRRTPARGFAALNA